MHQSVLLAAVAATLLPALIAQNTPAPCFEQNLGTNLNLGDDQVSQGNALGFTFPGPGNLQVTSIDISSNGFVWLASNSNPNCCNGYLASFLTDTPCIAPLWMDLYPPSGQGVYFNTFPATPTSLARAVVTWYQVPEFGGNTPFTFQLQLLEDGSFTFKYDVFVSNQYHDVLVGVTEGIAATANPVDYSTITVGTPFNSGTNPTIHEVQSMVFDMAGGSYEFLPNGTGGYIVIDRPGCVQTPVTPAAVTTFGIGCPQPAVAYELFPSSNTFDLSNTAIDFLYTGTGYVVVPTSGFYTPTSTPITTGDDYVTGPFTLPFVFPFAGGSTSQIDIVSNGFIWLSSGNWNARCCFGDPTAFAADGPSIAAMWMDLAPHNGGSIYYDVDPTNNDVHITWMNVPEYYNTGANTAQITLHSNGSFRLSYGTVANAGHDCLVGFSQGNGSVVPPSTDISMAMPFSIGAGGTPLMLDAQFGSLPQFGANFTMEVSNYAANSIFGVMSFGFGQFNPGIDLSGLGMPGCNQYITLDATQFFPLLANPAPFVFPVPQDVGLAGVMIQVQAATLSPGINPLGVAASNGLTMTIGQ